jgi:dihydroorotase
VPTMILRNCRLIGGFRDIEEDWINDVVTVCIDEQGRIHSVSKSCYAPSAGSERASFSDESQESDIDLGGAYLSPGWIDIHTHVYSDMSDISIAPSAFGPSTGVGCVCDAGSSSQATFLGFRKLAVEPAGFPVKAFINISSIGLVASNKVMEFTGVDCVEMDKIYDVAVANADVIRGIKVRASKDVTRHWDLIPVKMGKTVARMLGVPLMVHVGEPPVFIQDLVQVLDAGDIITHCFNGKIGSNLATTPGMVSILKDAIEKGIRLDIGHGSASFSFDAARYAIENGIMPFSISTDGYALNCFGPVYDMPTTMSKLLAVGMSLEQVVDCSSANPADVLGFPDWTSLRCGVKANLTAFRVRTGEFVLQDSNNRTDLPLTPETRKTMHVSKIIEPILTLSDGKLWKAESRYLSSMT